jgi:FlaA1/EpsC-like NDP-sugar epimerase
MNPSTSSYKFYSRLNQQIIDTLIFGVSLYLAYQIRFASKVPPFSEYQMWAFLVPVMLTQLVVTSLFGVYRFLWRYIGLRDTILIAVSHAASCTLIFMVCYSLPYDGAMLRIPRSILLIQYLLALVVALGVRALRRVTYEGSCGRESKEGKPKRFVLVGAGPAGVAVAKELVSTRDIPPVGFLDDDPQILGTLICGLRVLGPVDWLPSVVQEHQVEEVIICVAREQQPLLRRVWVLCEALPVRVRVIPTLDEILQGKINVSAFREVEMNQLTGRDKVQVAFTEETAAEYRGKRILITGAGGSIGSELANQLAKLHPQELILLDKDENGLNDACLQLRSNGNHMSVHAVVADLRFGNRIRGVFSRFRPEVVFHAAAHKHVPLMEVNPCEAILNNVIGTRNLVEQSLASSVLRFIFVSTDKAVRPTSIMGASKRVCEMIVRLHSRSGDSRWCCVRFGNVLGSRGSVVPIFHNHIAHGRALKLTHADVERFLMTIPEAVSLLLQAGTLGRSGETFVLDMGEPVLIRDLANRLIEHCGLRPGYDIPIEISKLGPGEKLSEQLFDRSTETLLPTSIAKINVIQSAQEDGAHFPEHLDALERAAREDRADELKRILHAMNIGFHSEEAPSVTEVPEETVFAAAPRGVPAVLQARTARQS